METLYKANDGTIFKDKDECVQYERVQKYTDNGLYSFGDMNGERIPLEDIIKDEDLSKVWFVICKSDEGFEQLCDLCQNFGYVSLKNWSLLKNNKPPYNWFWNDNEDRWEILDNVLEEAKRLKNIFENLAKRG